MLRIILLAAAIAGIGCSAQVDDAEPVGASEDELRGTSIEEHRREAERLAIELGYATPDDTVSTVPSLTLTLPGAAGTKCYVKDPGPPEKLIEIDCDTIVIIETDD